jgi:hypothetical protein
LSLLLLCRVLCVPRALPGRATHMRARRWWDEAMMMIAALF